MNTQSSPSSSDTQITLPYHLKEPSPTASPGNNPKIIKYNTAFSTPSATSSSIYSPTGSITSATTVPAFLRVPKDFMIDCPITGRVRRRTCMDDFPRERRAMLKRKWERICGLPREMREVRGGWVDGDSDLEFSEFEDAKKEREKKHGSRLAKKRGRREKRADFKARKGL